MAGHRWPDLKRGILMAATADTATNFHGSKLYQQRARVSDMEEAKRRFNQAVEISNGSPKSKTLTGNFGKLFWPICATMKDPRVA